MARRSPARARSSPKGRIRALDLRLISSTTLVGGGAAQPGVRSADEPALVLHAQPRTGPADRARRARGRARGRLRDDALRAPRTSPWFAVPAVALMVLPLLGRRRWPFARAGRGLGAGRGVLVRRRAARRVHARASPPPGWLAAFLLGNLRDAAQARIGLADRARRRGDRRLQRPQPRDRRLHLPPGPVRDRLAGRASRCASAPRRPRRPRSARARPSASARRRPASPSPRSARGSRASCTTSSRTP